MRGARVFTRSRPVGVALESDRLVAALPGVGPHTAGDCWTRMLTPASDARAWTDLAEAFRELKERLGEEWRQLFVALMPPMGRVRLIDLPGLSEDEAARVVRRDPSRFFPIRGEKLVIEVHGSGWQRSSPFVLAAAPSKIVDAIATAAASSGWSLGGIVPAQLAWSALAGRATPEDLTIHCATEIVLLRARRGALMSARRLPLSDLVISEVQQQNDGLSIGSPVDAAERAAALAPRARGPVLQSDLERATTRRTSRRRAVIRFGVAAALIILAAALELFGLEQEQGRVALERRRIHAEVAQSMATRESIAVVRERLAALRGIDANAPRWAELINALADELPSDAYLLSLTAEGDSLHLEGAAVRAAPVFDAVNAMPTVRSVRPDGPIRQELGGREGSEHFLLSAFVARAGRVVRSDIVPNGSASGGRP